MKKKPNPMLDFIKGLIFHLDAAQAIRMVSDQAGLQFDQDSGHAVSALEKETKALQEDGKKVKADISQVEHEIKQHSFQTSSGKIIRTPFADWQRRDQVMIVLSVVGAAIALLLGQINVFTTLYASGDIAYLERPWMAALIGGLLPLFGLALKGVTSFFSSDTSRRRYSLLIHLLAGGVVGAWIYYFSQSFTAPGAGIDWNALLVEAPETNSPLVGLQLAAELLVGVALSLRAEHILCTYEKHPRVLNDERLTLAAHRDKLKTQAEAIRQREAEVLSEIQSLQASRQQFINQSVVAYSELRRQVDAISS